VPVSLGGSDDLDNRALACASCNLAKSDRIESADPLTGKVVSLFNPRVDLWEAHFHWSDDHATLEGLTSAGRATVAALNMNSLLLLQARPLWFRAHLLP
jgi:HNH endonuclease